MAQRPFSFSPNSARPIIRESATRRQATTSPFRMGSRPGSLRITAGGQTAGLTGQPKSVYVSAGQATKTLHAPYDSSLSYLHQQMRSNTSDPDWGKSDEELILEGQAKMNAKWHAGFEQPGLRRAMAQFGSNPDDFGTRTTGGPDKWTNPFESYVDERGDLITNQRPWQFKYDSRTLEGRRKRFQMGRGPDPDYKAPPPPILRKASKGSNYKESGDSRDKTEMSVKTLEGTKSFKNKTANKKSSIGKLFSESASKVKRSKSSSKKEGRT